MPVRLVGPALTVYDSVYNVRLKRSFSGTQVNPEFRMKVSTNSLSFRGPEPDSFPSGGLLYLGDDFTVGYGVSDGEEFPAVVSARLKGTPLGQLPWVNAARSNSGIGHWVKFLRREGKQFAPRFVVLQFSDNDFADNIEDRLFSLAPDGGLVELPVAPAGMGRKAQALIEQVPLLSNSYLLGLVRQAFHSYSGNSPTGTAGQQKVDWNAARPHADSLAMALLRETASLCRENGWPAVAILFNLDPSRDSTVRNLLGSYGIPSASVPGKQARPDLYYVTDAHLNAAGHEYAADAVVRLLLSPPVPEVAAPPR